MDLIQIIFRACHSPCI